MANEKQIIKKEIVKSNRLIESGYKLTRSEDRLLDLALSKLQVIMLEKDLSAEDIQVKINKSQFPLIYVYVTDYKKEYGINNNTIYEELAMSADRLLNRKIAFNDEGDKKNVITKRSWAITSKFDPNINAVALQFHPDLISDLLIFKSCYTIFDFDVKKYIRSFYACKLYELLKQYEAFGNRTFELDDLRYKLGVEDEYPEYANFKQRVIKSSVEQITKCTDIHVEFDDKIGKIKNKVSKIKFMFYKQRIVFENKEQLSFLENKINPKDISDYNIVSKYKDLLGITITVQQINGLVKLAEKSIIDNNLDMGVEDYIGQKKIAVDEYAKEHDIDNLLSVYRSAIRDNWGVFKKKKTGYKTDNSNKRQYNVDELEKLLLKDSK